MSEPMHCEKCKKVGRRRRFTFCPDGWLFFEALTDNEEPESGVTIIPVCSKECADAIWEKGPGDLRRSEPYPPEDKEPPAFESRKAKSIRIDGQWVDIPPEISALKDPTELPFQPGGFVRVISGPHTGATGGIDFIDPPGKRALVNFGEGRRGGLTWVPLECLAGRGGGLWG